MMPPGQAPREPSADLRHAALHAMKILPLFALALCSACASYGQVRFQPNPLAVELAPSAAEGAADEGGLGRALVSVRGIRELAPDAGYAIDVRLRLDNEGTAPLTLLAERCELVDGSLEPLAAPQVSRREAAGIDPARVLVVAPGASGLFDLTFPFRADRGPDAADLSGLHLGWAVESAGRTLHQSATFERARRDDGYGYGYGYGFSTYGCHPWLGYHYHSYPYRRH